LKTIAKNTEEESVRHDRRSHARMAVLFLFYAGNVLPVLWLICFYSFVIRARLTLGTWPSYETGPGRRSFGFAIHEFFIDRGMLVLSLAFVVWCFLTTPASVSSRRFLALLCFWAFPVIIAGARSWTLFSLVFLVFRLMHPTLPNPVRCSERPPHVTFAAATRKANRAAAHAPL
jgi:hypothetical protein